MQGAAVVLFLQAVQVSRVFVFVYADIGNDKFSAVMPARIKQLSGFWKSEGHGHVRHDDRPFRPSMIRVNPGCNVAGKDKSIRIIDLFDDPVK